ncbi:SDR family oxidoreductase [Streptomyces albiaxialis]|uniref:SDR family oxidoreductase n=1 Tax=Streptomyces albiaxialis TaxID=329523 RepID=A0ABN2WVM7_9ACTN
MRVFVTGASGWIGSAVVPDLIDAGHRVVGLARSEASAEALAAAGAEALRGSLDDLGVLREAAAGTDGVIHLAYKHELAFFDGDPLGAAEADRRAVEALGEALAGSGKPFVLASGTPVEPGRAATEKDGHGGGTGAVSGRPDRMATAEWALALASRGVRVSVVRLPRTVHGEGDPGFVAVLARTARERGVAGHVGDGTNRWPAVHRLDAARLFRLALEEAEAGTTLHAVGDEGVPLRAVAEVIGRHLGLPVVPVPPGEAGEHFGWLAPILSADQPASGALTRELTGWRPTRPGLLEDLDAGHYFRVPPA